MRRAALPLCVVWIVCAAVMIVKPPATHANAVLQAGDVAPRSFYGRRLEPAGNVVLHGAGQTDTQSFLAYTRAVGPAQPMLFMTYVDLHDDLPSYFARLRAQLASLPQFAVPQIGVSWNAGDAAKHYEAQVGSGADDTRLSQLCDGLRSLARPVFVRPGYEFNGSWNGYEPRAYVAAFRRTVTHARACGLQNAAFLWDANAGALRRSLLQSLRGDGLMTFYPGDDFVDWWGINLFDSQDIASDETAAFLRAAADHRFPVMIAESTSQHAPAAGGQRTVETWFAPYFSLIARSPGIRAFCYIDWDWRQYPQWSDWGDDRVETNSTVLAFYRVEVSQPYIASALPRAATFTLLRAR